MDPVKSSSAPAPAPAVSKILCCLCGTPIIPNEAAMCLDCLRSQFDITDVVDKNNEVVQCKKCDRWNTAKDHWVHHDMESAGLLSCCLKQIGGIQKVKLIDAKWVWTEPHSKRMKILLTVERGVLDEKITLRQNCTVEFTIKNKQCLPCIHEATDHTWGALIQLRQNVGHKRSLYSLESAMVKAGLHNAMLNIAQSRDGLDLYFRARNVAEKVVDFISKRIPTKTKMSQKVVSKDTHSQTARVEYTIHVEVAPLCRGDLVVTDKALTGGAELMVVTKLTNAIYLLNPTTMHSVIVSSPRSFMKPFDALLTMHHLINFVVIDINPVTRGGGAAASSSVAFGDSHSWFQLAEAQVCREADLGENDTTFTVLTHLGRVLQAGDTVLGYDLQHTLVDESRLSTLSYDCPEIILVRKSYPEEKKPKKSSKKSAAKKRDAASASSPPTDAEADATPGLDLVDNLLSTDINEEAIDEFNEMLMDEAALMEELRGLGHEEVVVDDDVGLEQVILSLEEAELDNNAVPAAANESATEK
jgi:nonsense-mediated mRNA decay protein 3